MSGQGKDKVYPYLHRELESLEGEEWKDILNFEGYYMVSSLGRVKSLDRYVGHKSGKPIQIKGVILSQTMYRFKNHYTNDHRIALRVALSSNNKRFDFQVRRLVFQSFKGCLNPNMDVINNDGNGFNNKVDNLSMIEKSVKQKGIIQTNRLVPSLRFLDRSKFKKTYGGYSRQKPITQLSLDGNLISEFPSIAEAVRQTGCDEKSIITVAKGKWKHHRGFIWKYK